MITDSEDKSMIAELERVIRDEEAIPLSERDTDLIDECVREIAELKGVKAEFSDEELAGITDKLIGAEKQGQKRKRFIRLAAGIAAAIMIIGGITACSINPALINWIAEIVRMPFGSSVEQDKVTYYCHGESTEYDSIEQLLELNEWDIYYPTIFPNSIKLTQIELLTEDTLSTIVFEFNSNNFSYFVQLAHSTNMKKDKVVSSVEANGLHFDICGEDGFFISYSNFEGNSYVIRAESLDDIILVIGGLKKESK